MRKSLLLCLALASAFPTALAAESCKVVPANTPLTPAEQAYRDNDGKKALELYRAEISAKPNDPKTVEGLVSTLLWQGLDDEARAVLEKQAAASSAWILTAQSEYEFRQGHIEQAQLKAIAAVKADVCNAQARMQFAELSGYSAMFAQKKKQVLTARMLDQSDPEIYSAWLRYQPDATRLAEYKRMAADSSATEESRKFAARRAERLEDRMAGGGHACHIVSTGDATTVSMAPLMEDGNRIRAWGLSVKVNDHATTVLLDTGASGLVLNHAAAEKSGLKAIAKGKYGGIGDQGSVGLSFAYADRIRVGDLEFADCLVQIDDRRSIASAQGLIGTDVFEDRMVTLDFPLRVFRVSALPGNEKQNAALDTEGDSEDEATHPPQDPYDGPELKDFQPVYLVQSKVLLDMTLNGKPNVMIMDTGSDGTLFDRTKAKEFTSVGLDHSLSRGIEGVSGKVNNVYTTGEVQMKFGRIAQFQNGAMAIDFNSPTDMKVAGLLGSSFLYNLIVDIDYRDARVRFTYDASHGHNATVHH